MVLTVSFVLSPVTGLFCHRRLAKNFPRNLTPASGRQYHTTSPSASARFVKSCIRVHRIPPALMTLRNAPLSGRDARSNAADLPDDESGIFLLRGLDRANHVDAAQQISLLAQTLISSTSPQSKIVTASPHSHAA